MALVHLDDTNFDEFIEKAEKPVLVDFYADWCGPCQMIAPELEILVKDLKENQAIAKINVDDAQDIAMQYGVMSIPTLLLFKDGQKVDTKIGVQKADELETWMNSQN